MGSPHPLELMSLFLRALLIAPVVACGLMAQSPRTTHTAGCAPWCRQPTPAEVSKNASLGAGGAAPSNPWFTAGTTVAYKWGPGSFDNDLIGSGLVQTALRRDKSGMKAFHLDAIGNIGKLNVDLLKDLKETKKKLTDLVNGAEGFRIGLFPYWARSRVKDLSATVADTTNNLFVAWGSGSYKINGAQDTTTADSSTVYLHQFRSTAGVEWQHYWRKKDTLPATLSVELVNTTVDEKTLKKLFGVARSNIQSAEVTAVIPLFGFGALAQFSIDEEKQKMWRIGVLMGKAKD